MSRGQLQWASLNLTLLLEPHPVSAIIPDAPGQVRVHATLRVRNPGSDPAARVVFYLYRLLAVNSARLPHTEEPLRVRQRPQCAEFMEVNRVTLELPRPLAPGGEIDVSTHYGGPLVGYREVMPYVHDSVQRQFALLRPETLWYPVPAGPRPEGLDTILRRAERSTAGPHRRGSAQWLAGAVPGGTARAFQVDAPPLGLIVVAGRFRRVAEGAVTLVYLPGATKPGLDRISHEVSICGGTCACSAMSDAALPSDDGRGSGGAGVDATRPSLSKGLAHPSAGSALGRVAPGIPASGRTTC